MPATRYAKSGDVHIAYQAVGDGPVDVVAVAGWLTHVECLWDEPSFVRFVDQFLPWARVILFDKRGVGLSDRVPDDEMPPLEVRMDDLRAVLDAVDSQDPVLFAIHEAGPMACLFAASYPERTRALVLFGTNARGSWAPDYPWAPTVEAHARLMDAIAQRWGQGIGVGNFAPSLAGDKRFREWMARYERLGASPGTAMTLAKIFAETDARSVVPTIRVPTMVLHRSGDRVIPIGGGRWIAEHVDGAQFVELAGDDHWIGVQPEQIVGEVEQFVTGTRTGGVDDRVLASMLFTDIVDSTATLVSVGDDRWRDMLAEHHQIVRQEIDRARGRVVNTTGDGFLALFDGPARAIRAAAQAIQRLARLGIEIRAGIHTGEISLRRDDVGGLAVHLAARVAANAGATQIYVSRTVVDLVAGSGLEFTSRGLHELKGLPTAIELFEVRQPLK